MPLALPSKESRLIFPRPAAQRARRDGAALHGRCNETAPPAPPSEGRTAQSGFLRRGSQGGTFFLLKEGFPLCTPLQSPPRKGRAGTEQPLHWRCSETAPPAPPSEGRTAQSGFLRRGSRGNLLSPGRRFPLALPSKARRAKGAPGRSSLAWRCSETAPPAPPSEGRTAQSGFLRRGSRGKLLL